MNNKILLLKGMFYSLVTTLIFLPWSLSLSSYFTILSFFFWLCYILTEKELKIRQKKMFFIFISLFIVQIFWLYNTEEMSIGLKKIETSLSLFIFPLILSSIPKISLKSKKILLVSFLTSCIILYIYVIINNIDFQNIDNLNYLKTFVYRINKIFTDHYIHPVYFSMFLIFAIFSLLIDSFKKRRKWQFVFLNILLLFSFFISSKTPIIIIFLLLVILPLLMIKSFKKKIMIVASNLILISGIVIVLLNIPNRFTQGIYNYYNLIRGTSQTEFFSQKELGVKLGINSWKETNRLIIWKNAIEVVNQNILFGTGTGDSQKELIKQYEKNKESWHMRYLNTHNQYLDYLLKYGIFGLLLFLYVLFYSFYKAFKRNDFLYIIFLIVVSVCFLTENILLRQWGVMFYSFFNAFIFYHNTEENLKI